MLKNNLSIYVNRHTMYKDEICDYKNVEEGKKLYRSRTLYIIKAKLVLTQIRLLWIFQILIPMITTMTISEKLHIKESEKGIIRYTEKNQTQKKAVVEEVKTRKMV